MLLVTLGQRKSGGLVHKLTLVTHQPHRQEAQSCFLRSREIANPASPGLRELIHDIDHLAEAVFITHIIGYVGNVTLVTFVVQICKCQLCAS